MKLGILTFHWANNYGAILQCYGLQEVLKSLGHEVFVIDYRPSYSYGIKEYEKFTYKTILTRQLKYLPKIMISGLMLAHKRNKKYNHFNNFRTKFLNLYPANSNFRGEGFDLCIVGSDQIWNKNLTGGNFDPILFGEDFKCPVISYAASTILTGYNDYDKTKLLSLLSNLKAVSVREEKLSQFLNLNENTSTLVADPTLLAGQKYFYPLSKAIRKDVPDKYLLVYTIRENNDVYRIANEISGNLNLPIVEISSNFVLKRKNQKRYDVSIEEFVTLFNNASFVLTNSFHGTAFSLIFKKNFYSIRHNNEADDRINDLLTKLNMTDRFLNPKEKIRIKTPDYSNLDNDLEALQQSSLNFIINQLSIY